MFFRATSFTSDLSKWDVSKVTNMMYVSVIVQESSASCVSGTDFDVKSSNDTECTMWVNNGCRANFTLCGVEEQCWSSGGAYNECTVQRAAPTSTPHVLAYLPGTPQDDAFIFSIIYQKLSF